MRKKSILLCFIKPVYFIYKKQGFLIIFFAGNFCFFYRFTNILHT